jgi:hypothetical protein
VDKDGQEDGGELSRGQGSVKRSKKWSTLMVFVVWLSPLSVRVELLFLRCNASFVDGWKDFLWTYGAFDGRDLDGWDV